MSSFSMELRTYIEKWTQYDEGLTFDERLEKGRVKLFDFNYPIFDVNYKKIFETNFIKEFYMREIGFETEGLFKLRLNTWLNKHMPYYNKMFESELIEFDPLTNSEMRVTHEKKNDKQQNDDRNTTQGSTTIGGSDSTANSSGETINDDFARQLNSDNPDSRLQLTANDGEGVIEYASKISENNVNNKENSKADSTTNTTSNVESNASQNDIYKSDILEVEDYIQHRQGKIGVASYSKMLVEYRNSLVRIEQMIHDEMQELFMLVY